MPKATVARKNISKPTMSEADLRFQIAELAPFHHAIDLPFGLNTYDESMRGNERQSMGRIDSFKKHVWSRLLAQFDGTLAGKRVLDVACNCGGFSLLAADAGAAEVRGFDSEERYIQQAQFVKAAAVQTMCRSRSIAWKMSVCSDMAVSTYRSFSAFFIIWRIPLAD